MKSMLSPHGYEGRRASARPCFTPPALPTPPLPSPEVLAELGFSFEPVGDSADGPVRLRRGGHPLGVFKTRSDAASTIQRHST